MTPEEISGRLEFLESLCTHGPWREVWSPNSTVYRCTNCGAPIDHQHDFDRYPEDLVE